MDAQTTEIIIQAVFALLSAIVIYIIRPYIQQKVGSNRYNDFCEFCIKAEAAAAQLYDNNADKRDYVTTALIKYADEIGLNTDSETVKLVLEGVYKLYKDVINGEQSNK